MIANGNISLPTGTKYVTGTWLPSSSSVIENLIGCDAFCLFWEASSQQTMSSDAIISLMYTPDIKALTKSYQFGIIGSTTWYYQPGYADGVSFDPKTGQITISHANSGFLNGQYRYIGWKT